MDGLVKSEQHKERRMRRAVLYDYHVDRGSHLVSDSMQLARVWHEM